MEVHNANKDLLSDFLSVSYIFLVLHLPCQLQEKKLVAEIKREAKTGNEVCFVI